MNKTVNINLANLLFHIDENAFLKLQHYLDSIKRSFSGTAGSDEIIADIEARIAELFREKMENERQVITVKEVDAVIEIMGQPEDYQIDEDIFADGNPGSSAGEKTYDNRRIKKLYRDVDHKFIGGVCAGMEHYLAIDALWIRLIFVILGIFTGFGFIAYILLWILVPEATTTAQKLDMTGEPVNISNIERKVKEGIEDVAEKVRNVNYDKVGERIKSGGKSVFDVLGEVILFGFKVIGKFVGILLILIGMGGLIGLCIALFTVGIIDAVHIPGIDLIGMLNSTEVPVWMVSILVFLVVGIPFFLLMYLGLRIVVSNLKSIGNIAKFSLLGLWLISMIALAVISLKQASAYAYTGSVSEVATLSTAQSVDSLIIRFTGEEFEHNQGPIVGGMRIHYDEQDNAILYSENMLLDVLKSSDAIFSLRIRKDADGSSVSEARERAGQIDFKYTLEDNVLELNKYFTTPSENKVRDQQIRLTLYVPEGTKLVFEPNTRYFLGRRTQTRPSMARRDLPDYKWKMGGNGVLECVTCPDRLPATSWGSNDNRVIIDENGVDIDLKGAEDRFRMRIDEEGIDIKTKPENRP